MAQLSPNLFLIYFFLFLFLSYYQCVSPTSGGPRKLIFYMPVCHPILIQLERIICKKKKRKLWSPTCALFAFYPSPWSIIIAVCFVWRPSFFLPSSISLSVAVLTIGILSDLYKMYKAMNENLYSFMTEIPQLCTIRSPV